MATHTVLSLLYQVRLAVNDLDTNRTVATAGKWLSDNDYNAFIARGYLANEAPHTFTLRGTGLWVLDGFGGNPRALRFASDTAPFTPSGTTSNVYVTDCFGSIQTSGTDTTASYSVTAGEYNFAHIMSELFFWMAQNRSLQIASANGQYVGETVKQLRDAAGFWEGITL